MFSYLATSLIGKILAGTVAFAATGGTLAATGSLPDPIQAAVANTVQVVGIEVPNPSEPADAIEAVEASNTEDIIELTMSGDAVEPKDAAEAVELDDEDATELEDAEASEEAEHGMIGLECADKATELGDSGEAMEVDGSDSATQIGESEEAKELDCSDEATELEEAEEAQLEEAEEAQLEEAEEAEEAQLEEAEEAEEAQLEEAEEAEEATETGDADVTTTTAAPQTGSTGSDL